MVFEPSVLHTSIAHVSKPSSGSTATQYVIRVSDERAPGLNWTVYRRYSEFRDFRLRLEDAIKKGDMCDHCDIMAKRTCFMQFPHRRLFGSMKESVLETRRIGLNAFLDAVTRHARACRESMTCQTRPLMDQFLMVNDMRYTYLNVNMSEQEEEFYSKLAIQARDSISSASSAPTLSVSSPKSQRQLRHSSSGSEYRSKNDDSELLASSSSSSQRRSRHYSADNIDTTGEHFEGRVLRTRLNSLPNLLDYKGNDRNTPSSSRGSVSEEPSTHHTGRLSDWETAKYQTTTAPPGRHSDPGLNRNDLLSFASTGRRSELRNRARKVHLSSAAKRVKKLEEQEARFSTRPPTRVKKFTVLETIYE
ncbi:hypothetical protein Poli38472_002061 [Pythium oligandrum]|uniref:PX domain-containing protein n=1 Tax=Pythium oligandrum TaxID=41045 RepID=A0A8K1FGT3_PYTOL|nr:hypothetical protein Poli38472_002061 [Pythium oligandrum]|eukprot:TMW63120.1 hypothetical protein Poli38472_002061 [Pythium oligandrum]